MRSGDGWRGNLKCGCFTADSDVRMGNQSRAGLSPAVTQPQPGWFLPMCDKLCAHPKDGLSRVGGCGQCPAFSSVFPLCVLVNHHPPMVEKREEGGDVRVACGMSAEGTQRCHRGLLSLSFGSQALGKGEACCKSQGRGTSAFLPNLEGRPSSISAHSLGSLSCHSVQELCTAWYLGLAAWSSG